MIEPSPSRPASGVSAQFDDVACTVCGCVCDDLQLTVQGGRISQATNACRLAEPWFLQQGDHSPPAAAVGGVECPFETAIERAAGLLRRSRSPLIYGLSRSSTPGQRVAVALADRLGATIDTTASRCHAPSLMALQEVGESTCSLGEIRQRADLVIFWGANPVESHPRHLERYSALPTSELLPRGRRDRTVVVVDVRKTPSAEQADLFIQVEPGRDFEVLWALRGLTRGIVPDPGVDLGADRALLECLADMMRGCRCGVAFFGLGLSLRGLGHRNVEALLLLVRDLNDFTRFHARRMRIPGDVTGADSVLCWQTGYPFSVNLANGFPRYNPGEFSASEMLSRREVDSCLLVGSEGVSRLDSSAQQYLTEIPTVVLDHPGCSPPFTPTVQFTTDVYGIHYDGTAYRMDEVPIPLRQILPPRYASDETVLSSIAACNLDATEI